MGMNVPLSMYAKLISELACQVVQVTAVLKLRAALFLANVFNCKEVLPLLGIFSALLANVLDHSFI